MCAHSPTPRKPSRVGQRVNLPEFEETEINVSILTYLLSIGLHIGECRRVRLIDPHFPVLLSLRAVSTSLYYYRETEHYSTSGDEKSTEENGEFLINKKSGEREREREREREMRRLSRATTKCLNFIASDSD